MAETAHDDQAFESATRDALTGLKTRGWFDEVLHREVAFVRRHPQPLAVFVVDLDGFKALAEAHGGPTSDQFLAAVGHALRELLGADALLARLGSEVFGLVERGLDRDQSLVQADHLRQAVAKVRVQGAGGPVQATASVGVALFHAARAATPDELLRAAEHALLRAKQQGRNRCEIQADGLPAPAPTPPV